MEKYQYDPKRYQIKDIEEPPVVALWGAAIRTHLWNDTYKRLLETNDCKFKMFLCGHHSPEKPLCEGIVFIHSSMNANACAEISFRHAVESGAKYMMYWQDDLVPSPGLLDAIIQEIDEAKDTELVCGAAFRPTLPGQRCRAQLDKNGYLKGQLECVTGQHNQGIVVPTMRTSTARKMGGFDKRFKAIQQMTESLIRLADLGNGEITFKTCDKVEVAEDMSVQEQLPGRRGRRSSREHGDSDDFTLYSIWNFSSYPAPFKCHRNLENEYYTDEELEFKRWSSLVSLMSVFTLVNRGTIIVI